MVRAQLLFDDFQKFDLKNQRRVGWNRTGNAPAAVSQSGRTNQLCLAACLHRLYAFGPARDDPVQWKGGRLPATVGTIEFLSVLENASVVHLDGFAALRAGAGTFLERGYRDSRGGLYFPGFSRSDREGKRDQRGNACCGQYLHVFVLFVLNESLKFHFRVRKPDCAANPEKIRSHLSAAACQSTFQNRNRLSCVSKALEFPVCSQDVHWLGTGDTS